MIFLNKNNTRNLIYNPVYTVLIDAISQECYNVARYWRNDEYVRKKYALDLGGFDSSMLYHAS